MFMRCPRAQHRAFSITALQHTRSMTEVGTSESGRTTKCMATGLTHGLVEKNISENSGTEEIRMEFSILRPADCRELSQTASGARSVSRTRINLR